MYSSVAYDLQENGSLLVSLSRKFRAMVRQARAKMVPGIGEDKSDIKFLISQVAKKKHGCEHE